MSEEEKLGSGTAVPGWNPQVPYAGRPQHQRKQLLVIALAAGLITWLAWPASEANRKPFDQAVANLAGARGLRYSSSFDGVMLNVTALTTGEVIGTLSFGGQDFGVLEVGGKTYLKPPAGLIPGASGNTPASVLKGKWVTGDIGLFAPILSQFASPPTLARRLWDALQQTNFPVADSATSIDGIPALKADTTAGRLYVAKDMPYRVLRFIPGQPTLPILPSARPSAQRLGNTAAQQEQAETGQLDLESLSAPQIDQTYDDLQNETEQLSHAVDTAVQFTLEGGGAVNCGDAGCSVTENFTGRLGGGSGVQVTGGQVRATMTVTVAINGESAGDCTSAGTFPIFGSSVTGKLSCEDGGAGAVFASVDAEMKAQAEAESEAEDGASVPYTIPYTAKVEVVANALAEAVVQELVDQEDQERQSADCSAPSNSFVAGTLVLLADGTTRPIKQVTPGTDVLTTDPVTGQTNSAPVLQQIVGSGVKQLDELTVTGGGRTGNITATTTHPFWDPDRHVWVAAGELHPGERLAAAHGSDVRVVATHGYQQTLTVYNLTVADDHTYYLVAGGNAVLVHNASGPPCRMVNGWPKQEGGNCDACAEKIQKMIGGKIIRITPRPPGNMLGPSTENPDGDWAYHVVVLKDGRIYDGPTGPNGLPINQFKNQWGEDADEYIDFGLG